MTYHDPKRIALYALRGFIAYLFYLLILHMTTGLLFARGIALPGMGAFNTAYLSRDFDLPFDYAYALNILVIPFLYYSVVRAFALGDAYGYYAAEEETGRVTLASVIATMEYRVALATAVLGYLIFPLSFGMKQLRAWPDFAAVLGPAVERVLFGIVLLPCYALLLALAHRSARREWQSIRKERSIPTLRDESSGLIGFFKDKSGLGGLISTAFLILWLYPIGVFAAAVLFSVILPFLVAIFRSPVGALWALAFVLAVVLLFIVPSYLRALSKRRKLMRELRKVCRHCGYELTVTGHPYLGLIFYRGGADFSIKTGSKQYDCKLLASIMSGGKMLFGYDGRVEIHHYIRFFWAARAMHTATMHTFEQSTFHTEIDYSFDSEHQKVLVVCPVAPQTYVAGAGGGTPIDTGAHIGEYRMFNTTGFLGALERDCLDR